MKAPHTVHSAHNTLRDSRALRWIVGVGIAAMAGIGLILLFLLTQATNNRELYERNYSRLFTLNVVVAAMLLLVIGWIAVRLFLRLRQKKFGSRLLVKLAAIFALAGFAPGVLIYVISTDGVQYLIDTGAYRVVSSVVVCAAALTPLIAAEAWRAGRRPALPVGPS